MVGGKILDSSGNGLDFTVTALTEAAGAFNRLLYAGSECPWLTGRRVWVDAQTGTAGLWVGKASRSFMTGVEMKGSVYQLRVKRRYRTVERKVEDILARHPAPIIRLDEERLKRGYLARVIQVVDGDTVVVHDGSNARTIRLTGVDSPELGDPQGAGQHAAWKAAMWTREFCMGEIVVVVAEWLQDVLDRYGREVAYLVRQPDGGIVNVELVRAGHARATLEHLTVLAYELHELEVRARVTRRGMWAGARAAAEVGVPV